MQIYLIMSQRFLTARLYWPSVMNLSTCNLVFARVLYSRDCSSIALPSRVLLWCSVRPVRCSYLVDICYEGRQGGVKRAMAIAPL